MPSKKILILYTSVGLGHKSIAENIGAELSKAGHAVRLEDILEVQSGWLVACSKAVHHVFSAVFPFIWSFLYQNEWLVKRTLPWRARVASRNRDNTQLILDGFSPDIVISTQATASAVVASLKRDGKFTGLFGIAFSDFHLHRYWLYDEADFYLANIEEQKREMEELGIPREKIYVCGIALPPKAAVSTEEVRQKFGIQPGERVVVVSSGSLGTGLSPELLERLTSREGVRVLAVCGKNRKVYGRLSRRFAGSHVVTVLGYYTPMDELYAIADVFITKPGGLSVAEALRWDLPMVISHMLPGQEELNLEYLEDKGLIMPEPIVIESAVWEELETQSFRSELRANPAKEVICGRRGSAVSAVEAAWAYAGRDA